VKNAFAVAAERGGGKPNAMLALSARGAVFAERGLIQNVESAKITTRKNAHPL